MLQDTYNKIEIDKKMKEVGLPLLSLKHLQAITQCTDLNKGNNFKFKFLGQALFKFIYLLTIDMIKYDLHINAIFECICR